MPRLLPLAAAAAMALALGAAGCGDDGERSSAPSRDAAPRDTASSSRAADVVRRWADTLRSGDVDGAARLWAVPSRAQNGTPLLRLRSREEVRAFNAALPCGAVVTDTREAEGGFIVAEFRLTGRPGGDCAGGEGGTAQVAIRVRDGRITDWLRVPGRGEPPLEGGPIV